MFHPVLISAKNLFCCFVCLFLSSNILLAQKKNTFSYDLMNARKGYAPLHLQYERSLSSRFSLQMSVNRFRVEDIQLLPKNTTTTVYNTHSNTGDAFTSFIFWGFSSLLNGPEPSYGTLTADYNQRGVMVGFGPKFYFSAPNRICRPYAQVDFQYYSYRYDQYQFTRTKGMTTYSHSTSQYEVRTSEKITENLSKTAMVTRLDAGIQLNLSKRITAEVGVSLGVNRENAKAEKAKDAFQISNKVNAAPQIPIRATIVSPLHLSVGYRF